MWPIVAGLDVRDLCTVVDGWLTLVASQLNDVHKNLRLKTKESCRGSRRPGRGSSSWHRAPAAPCLRMSRCSYVHVALREKGPSFSRCLEKLPRPVLRRCRRRMPRQRAKGGSWHLAANACRGRRTEHPKFPDASGGGCWGLCPPGSLKKRDLFPAAPQGCAESDMRPQGACQVPCAVPGGHRPQHASANHRPSLSLTRQKSRERSYNRALP
jgi:hypothetical protein